jgi:riboflavin transporter FmnP
MMIQKFAAYTMIQKFGNKMKVTFDMVMSRSYTYQTVLAGHMGYNYSNRNYAVSRAVGDIIQTYRSMALNYFELQNVYQHYTFELYEHKWLFHVYDLHHDS